MPRPAHLALLALALSACSQRAPAGGAAGTASTAPASAATASVTEPTAAPASATASVTAVAPALPPPGGLADAYRGTLDPAIPITMRLRRKAGALEGTYFYDAKGLDIALTGVLATNGTLTLTESSAGKNTGTFAGRLDPDTGGISGTWTDPRGGGARAFELDPIPRRAGGPAVVRKKWYRWRHRAKQIAPRGSPITACAADLAYPEAFGLADPAVEAVVNDKLRLALRRDRDEHTCDAPYATHGGYAVHLDRAGVLSVSYTYDTACDLCAHPSFGGAVLNVLLDSGADLPLERLLAPGGRLKIFMLLEGPVRDRIKATAGATAEDAPTLRNAYLGGDYVIEDAGLRLIAFFRLPHAVQALDGDFGVVLPWASLAPALDPKGPAAAIRPAP